MEGKRLLSSHFSVRHETKEREALTRTQGDTCVTTQRRESTRERSVCLSAYGKFNQKESGKNRKMDVDKILSYSNDPKTDFYAILNCPPTATVKNKQFYLHFSLLERANHCWIPRTFAWTASGSIESKRRRLSRAPQQISTRARGQMRVNRR